MKCKCLSAVAAATLILSTTIATTPVLANAQSVSAPVSQAAFYVSMTQRLAAWDLPSALAPCPYWDVLRAGVWNALSFDADNGWIANVGSDVWVAQHYGPMHDVNGQPTHWYNNPMPSHSEFTYGIGAPIAQANAVSFIERMFGINAGKQSTWAWAVAHGWVSGSANAPLTYAQAAHLYSAVRAWVKATKSHPRYTAQGLADLHNPSLATQGGAAAGMLATFDELPAWPASVPTDYNDNSAGYDEGKWYMGVETPFESNPLSWVGLSAVFPADKTDGQFESSLGIKVNAPKAAVTVGQVAQWVYNWAVIARKLNVQYQVGSHTPWQWANMEGIFWGLGKVNPSSKLTAQEMQIVEWDTVNAARGYRVTSTDSISFLPQILTIGTAVYKNQDTFSLTTNSYALLTKDKYGNESMADFLRGYWTVAQMESQTLLTVGANGVTYYRPTNPQYRLGSSLASLSSKGLLDYYLWFENSPTWSSNAPIRLPYTQGENITPNVMHTDGYLSGFTWQINGTDRIGNPHDLPLFLTQRQVAYLHDGMIWAVNLGFSESRGNEDENYVAQMCNTI